MRRKGEGMKQENLEALRGEYYKVKMKPEQIKEMEEQIMKAKQEKRKNRYLLTAVKAAAAVAAVFIILPNTSAKVAYAMSGIPVVGRLVDAVTFRNYQYEDERHKADVEVPELVVAETAPQQDAQEAEKTQTLQKTTEEINKEIEEITNQIITEFQADLKNEEGYQDVMVKSEVLATTDKYFALKLICYQGAGSGAEWNYFYTVDLDSGKRIALKDLFVDGADYIDIISENIKEQMREQMAADDSVMYWLDDEEVPEWNFKQITDETSFYVNQNDEVVIAFNEGDVGPMSMGCVEFVIPSEILKDIRK